MRLTADGRLATDARDCEYDVLRRACCTRRRTLYAHVKCGLRKHVLLTDCYHVLQLQCCVRRLRSTDCTWLARDDGLTSNADASTSAALGVLLTG